MHPTFDGVLFFPVTPFTEILCKPGRRAVNSASSRSPLFVNLTFTPLSSFDFSGA